MMRPQVLIAAIRSAATYLAVSAYVLFAAPVGMALAAIFRWKGILYILGHGGVRLGLALSGMRVHVEGREHLPLDRAAVYCANHQSNVDPPILFDVLHPRMHIVYKAEIDAIPLLARAFRHGGFISIERRNRESAMRSLEAGAASIRAGNSFLVFPEGTRSRTDALLPFKKGGFLMALKARAPIVPVAVQGGRDAMRRGSPIIRPATISIRVGAPIETAGRDAAGRDALIAEVRTRIEGLLAQGPVLD
ncbi:MAG: 1-acyl-sn-glycerol-3-phosphate acyltransferase [Acidobacteria bacterium]|nr:1-acyl-sn-glycerol-3-phosphate acyltransferase [Acidobacteriota bacterium]